MIGANPGYAPASWTIVRRYARTFPSRVPPMVISWRWARPCSSACMLSERVSVQRTGRWSAAARPPSMISSPCNPDFGPNPPPTAGVTTRTTAGAYDHRQDTVHSVRDLRGRPVHELAVGGPRRRRRADLERARGEALVHELFRDHHLATVEQVGGCRAARPCDAESTQTLVPASRKSRTSSSERDQRVDDDRPRVVVDHDELRGVFTLLGDFRSRRPRSVRPRSARRRSPAGTS